MSDDLQSKLKQNSDSQLVEMRRRIEQMQHDENRPDDIFSNEKIEEVAERPKPNREIYTRFLAYGGDPHGVTNECAALLTLAEMIKKASVK